MPGPDSSPMRSTIGLPAWILVGAGLGILAGVIFGERAAILRPVGSAYAMMLQVAVYPYLLCSLLAALGKLTPAMALRLLKVSWAPYLFMWVLTLSTVWLVSHAIPPAPPPILLTPDMLRGSADFLNLLIPANLFVAFDRNYVPAIVVFAIVYGVAIQKIPAKASLIEVLGVVQAASVAIWSWIVRLAPFGVFALMATTAGSVQPERLAGLVLYVGLYLTATFLLAFVVLPAVLSMVAPIGYRDLLAEFRPAIVLALVTTLSVAALPFVQKAAERVVQQAGCPDGQERNDVVQASLSLSYVLAQLGNQFVYLLMLYAAWYYHVRLEPSEQVLLPFWTVLASVGSPSASINSVAFLGGWLHLPSDVMNLYLETSTVTRYGQVALSVMGFAFATVTVPLVYFGKVVPRWQRGAALLATGAILILAVVLGSRPMLGWLAPPVSNSVANRSLDAADTRGVSISIDRQVSSSAAAEAPRPLSAIRERGVLRVGYNPHAVPFSYRNKSGQLVGYDIAYAVRLARDLGVRLELSAFDWNTLDQDLRNNRFDIAVGGLYATDERLRTLTISNFYATDELALIVPSSSAGGFVAWPAVADRSDLRLAITGDPALLAMARQFLPKARLVVVSDYDGLAKLVDQVDAALWTKEQGAAWVAMHPGFTAVVPAGLEATFMFAYLLPPGAHEFQVYLDHWIYLHERNGFMQEEKAYWLEGKSRAVKRRRWNLFDSLFAPAPAGVPASATSSG